MCVPFQAEPPIDQGGFGFVAETRPISLEAADGATFAGFVARAGESRGVGMVVLPDVRGLFHFYEELAKRFAEANIDSVAIDYFGRTAGIGSRDENFPWSEHIPLTRATQIAQDVAAAVAYLRSPAGGSCKSVFSVGFCFGGGNSWVQAANGHGLQGVIGFYGRPGAGRDGSPGPVERSKDFACPVLALFGGDDPGIPQEHIDEFEAALQSAGVQYEVVVYPGAPHSFFDRTYEQYAAESADAWQRMVGFVEKYKLS